ncbi:MAG: hypothetical protein R3E02_07795 [Blastomonas sp.]
MSARLKSWKRVLAVRETQCRIAIGDAVNAQRAEATLEHNAARLKKLQQAAYQTDDCASGSALHAQLELGQRLLQANNEIDNALTRARQNLARAERQRTAAYIERETTGKLLDRTRMDISETAERKAAAMPRFQRKTRGWNA